MHIGYTDFPIGIGLSTEKDPAQAAQEAIEAASMAIQKERVDLAIVFSTIDFAYSNMLKTINFTLKERVPIVGLSGAAIIANQGIYKHGIVVMLLGLPDGVSLTTSCIKDIKTKEPLNAGRELGEKLFYQFQGVHRVLSIIFSDGLMDGSSNFIYGLQERLGKSFPLVGASACDNFSFSKTCVYYNKEVLSDSAVGILWGGKLNFGLGIKHGWKPLGKQRTITKCEGNIVYEIDNVPAAKIYEEYLASDLSELQKDLKRISTLYPLGIYLPGEKEYLLRNTLSIEKNGSLRLQGSVTEGGIVRLMIGTKESCLEATQEAVEEAKKGLSNSTSNLSKEQKNNFILVFDSVSRYILLKREASKELEIIKKGLGENTPIIGLYTYGEQAPLSAISYQGQTYFHNQTIAILAIGG